MEHQRLQGHKELWVSAVLLGKFLLMQVVEWGETLGLQVTCLVHVTHTSIFPPMSALTGANAVEFSISANHTDY